MGNQAVEIDRWQVGDDVGGSTGAVALTAQQLEAARRECHLAVSFGEAVERPLPKAPQVQILVPPYRGMRLVPLLAWLVTERLAQPNAEVTWLMTKRQGPDSVRRLLVERGWELTKTRVGRMISLRGRAPASSDRPAPREFVTDLGARSGVTMAADYGVFSPERVDDGTALLLEIAVGHPAVSTVADIGVGYGALSIGLVLNGVAESAVGTDVDALALWLAALNARTNGVDLKLGLTADPCAVPQTALTVCNVPTHISAEETAPFMLALAERARYGQLLIVVHASLEHRYTRHLSEFGQLSRFPGPKHVVLGIRR